MRRALETRKHRANAPSGCIVGMRIVVADQACDEFVSVGMCLQRLRIAHRARWTRTAVVDDRHVACGTLAHHYVHRIFILALVPLYVAPCMWPMATMCCHSVWSHIGLVVRRARARRWAGKGHALARAGACDWLPHPPRDTSHTAICRRFSALASSSFYHKKIVYTSRFVRVILAQGPC